MDTDESNKTIGILVRKIRTQLGLSQHQLGRLTGTSGSYISYVESGKAIPSLVFSYKIEIGFNLKNPDLTRLKNEMALNQAKQEMLIERTAG